MINKRYKKHKLSMFNKYIYLDTSAINYFNTIPLNNLIKMKKYLKNKNYYFCISNITLMEILNTKDIDMADNLIDTCKILIETDILSDPSILLVNFIKLKNKNEFKFSFFESLFRENKLNRVWHTIKKDPRRTFIVNDTHYTNSKEELITCTMLNNTLKELSFEDVCVDYGPECKNSICQIRIEQIRIAIIFSILSFNKFSNKANKFWEKLKISDTKDRLSYISKELNYLYKFYPVVLESYLYEYQITTKTTRGSVYDAFHIMYLQYFSFFLTNDMNIVDIKYIKEGEDMDILKRILDVKEFYNSFEKFIN